MAKKPPADPSVWTLHHLGNDYVAQEFEEIGSWIKDKRIPPDSEVFNPESQEWVRPETLVPRVIAHVLATTTMSIEGYRIVQYLDIDSAEVVIGTGVFSEFSSDVADFFGQRSTGFERKLQAAKQAVLQMLRLQALRKGGDAVVGVDLDYTEFTNNRIGVIASGTIVKLNLLPEEGQ